MGKRLDEIDFDNFDMNGYTDDDEPIAEIMLMEDVDEDDELKIIERAWAEQCDEDDDYIEEMIAEKEAADAMLDLDFDDSILDMIKNDTEDTQSDSNEPDVRYEKAGIYVGSDLERLKDSADFLELLLKSTRARIEEIEKGDVCREPLFWYEKREKEPQPMTAKYLTSSCHFNLQNS